MAYRAQVGMALCSQTLPPQKLCPRRLADEEQGLSLGPLEVSLAPAQCSLRGRFWRSGDRLIKLRCVPVHSPVACYVNEHHQ